MIKTLRLLDSIMAASLAFASLTRNSLAMTDAVKRVEQCLEMLPGVPYTQKNLQEMLDDGGMYAVREDVPGWERVSCEINMTQKRRKKNETERRPLQSRFMGVHMA